MKIETWIWLFAILAIILSWLGLSTWIPALGLFFQKRIIESITSIAAGSIVEALGMEFLKKISLNVKLGHLTFSITVFALAVIVTEWLIW
ncbi:MAG: hypothetical protein GOV00_00570 [Candidatus Altiarchaeota archaeon]|nr:hypothetical protein [Candidatus Altiarchaeota archaeon]